MLTAKKQKDPFIRAMFSKLWWPAMISAVGLSFGDMADALVVGQKMGETGLAAISLCLPLYMVINVFIYGLGVGGSVRYATLMGEGKAGQATENFNHLLKGGLVLGILLAILGNIGIRPIMFLLGTRPADGIIYKTSIAYGQLILVSMPCFFVAYILNYYLCCEDREKLATFGFTVGSIVDISCNILFVLVLDFGVRGAATATILGQMTAIFFYLPGIVRVKSGNLKFIRCGLNIREFVSCFVNGFSSSVQFIWQMFFFIIVNHILIRMFGSKALAVFDVLQNMSYMIMYVYEGTVKALQPIVSTFRGERNTQSMRETLYLGMIYGNLAALALMLLICLFPGQICRFFGITDAQILSMGCSVLRIYCTGAMCGGICVILQGYEQACEEVRSSYLISMLRSAVILFPVIFVCAALGKDYFWWFFPVTEVLSLIIYLLYQKFFVKKSAKEEEQKVYRGLIENTTKDLGQLMSDIEQFCESRDADMKQMMLVNMVAEEVCTAIMTKGFQADTRGYIQLTLLSPNPGVFEFHIRDNAVKFNPFALQTAKASMDEEFDMDAMGILMIRKKVKYFFYRQYQGFNTLVIRV